MKSYSEKLSSDLHVSEDSQLYLENMLHDFFVRRMGELLPGFLHNLGNPLSVILGNAELLSLSYEKDIVNDVISMATDMKYEIKRLQKIMQTIMQTGSRYSSLKDVIIDQTTILRHDLTFKHKMTLTTRIEPECSEILVPALEGNTLFAIIFRNLIEDFKFKKDLEQLDSAALFLTYEENEIPEVKIQSSAPLRFVDEEDQLFQKVVQYLACDYYLSPQSDNEHFILLRFENINGD